MRTTLEENEQMGKIFAEKLNEARGPGKIFIPMGGFSELDFPGELFWWPEADQAFVAGLKSKLNRDISIVISEKDVNDPEFSGEVARALLDMVSNGD